ncbi:MAG: hypothetical protein U5J63_04700 [Fodinibius sp.]|nr:hypothetical protein [Fodinibius sp.]
MNVIIADTDEQAKYLSTSLKQMFMGVVTGNRDPMPPPVDDMNTVWNFRTKMAVEQIQKYTFVGSKETVQEKLTNFVEKTEADELMTATYMYDHDQRLKSHQHLAGKIKKARLLKVGLF